MAYQSLYRLYRPQNFNEVTGQKYILKTLKNSIKENKLAHAYIFCGPRGTGKTTMARLLAKGANCTSESDRPCNVCPNCQAVSNNSHPDIIELDAASYNSVEDIRDIIDKVKYTPIMGKYKVYIVDEIHMLSNAAYNAFLKTLEEPPAHVIFILATTESHKVLPTILSRCQRFDFSKISTIDIAKRIEAILKKEEITYSEETINLISQLSEGSMRDALSTLDQTIAYAGNNITEEDVKDIYGIASVKDKTDFLLAIANKDVAIVLSTIENFNNKGIDLTRFTNELINCLKDIIIYATTKNSKLLTAINLENAQLLRNSLSINECLKMIDFFIEAINNYKKSTAVKSFLEIAVLKMCEINKDLITYVEPMPGVQIRASAAKEAKPAAPTIVSETPIQSKKQEEIKVPEIKIENEVKKEVVSEAISIEPEIIPSNNIDKYLESEESQYGNEEIEITKEMILNVLVQASFQEKDFINERWPLIKSKYLNLPKTSLVASILADGKPVAMASGGIIVAYPHIPQVNKARKKRYMNSIIQFIKMITDRDYIIFPISASDFEIYRNEYQQLRQIQRLPKPQPISPLMDAVNVEKKESDSPESKLKSLFGDKFIEE